MISPQMWHAMPQYYHFSIIEECWKREKNNWDTHNSKLKERSVRILSSLFPDIDRQVIRRQLIVNDYDVRKSIEDLIKGKEGEVESTEKESPAAPSIDFETFNKNCYHFLKKDGDSDQVHEVHEDRVYEERGLTDQ